MSNEPFFFFNFFDCAKDSCFQKKNYNKNYSLKKKKNPQKKEACFSIAMFPQFDQYHVKFLADIKLFLSSSMDIVKYPSSSSMDIGKYPSSSSMDIW